MIEIRALDPWHLRAGSRAVLAGAVALTVLVVAGCSPRPGATASPAQHSSASASAAPTSPADPRSGWSAVSHFVGANENTYVAALRLPPAWHYMPAPRSHNCATTWCYSAMSDRAVGPPQSTLAMGGPTAMGAGESCSDYARGETGAGYALVSQEQLSVGGIVSTEYAYSRVVGGVAWEMYVVPLESNLLGCVSLTAAGTQSTLRHGTVDLIFTSIEFHAAATV